MKVRNDGEDGEATLLYSHGEGKVARLHGCTVSNEQHTSESPSRAEQISSDLGQ